MASAERVCQTIENQFGQICSSRQDKPPVRTNFGLRVEAIILHNQKVPDKTNSQLAYV